MVTVDTAEVAGMTVVVGDAGDAGDAAAVTAATMAAMVLFQILLFRPRDLLSTRNGQLDRPPPTLESITANIPSPLTAQR